MTSGLRDFARPVEIVILGGKITVKVDYGSGYVTEINDYDLSPPANGQAPPTFKLGFSGSTGGATNLHEIRDLSIRKPGDLSIAMSADKTVAASGDPVVLTVVVRNDNTNTANGGSVLSASPGFTYGAWTCTASAGSTCPASGSGNLNASVNLDRNGVATFTINTTFAPSAGAGSVQATAELDTDLSDISDVNSANNEASTNVTVTVTVLPGTLVAVKQTTGGDGAFSFISQALGNFVLTTTNGTAQRTFTPLAPGVYDVSETALNGWRLDSATCSDGSNPASVNLAAGENVTCIFKNAKQDSIIVVKRAVGGDATFDFVSQSLGNFTLTTVNGQAQRSFDNLADGVYDLSETVPAGWTLSIVTGSDGSPVYTLALHAAEPVTCTFDNAKQDTLIVEKRTRGGDGAFAFTSPQLGAFTLTTSGGTTAAASIASQSFTGLAAGTYSIAETVPAGWRQTGATCDNGDAPVVVEKRTRGGDGAFAFTATGPAATPIAPFTLTTSGGVASQSFTGLAAGTYNIAETVPAGWRQTGATCDNGNPPSNVQLAPGQTVKCTFDNEKQDTITVVKRAVGGDGSFDFVSQSLGNFSLTTVNGEARRSFGNLAPGTYSIAETVPAGWNLSDATCSDGSNPASVQLSPGEAVACTFTNLKQNSIVVEQRAQDGDGAFAFTSPQLGAFTLTTRSGTASRAFAALPAGAYAISQTTPAGWTLVGATCDNGDPPDSIRLGSGQAVKCTFVSQFTAVITAIPTLSQWGLLLLGALLALVARWRGPMRPAERR